MSTITLNKMVEIPLSPDDFKKFFSGYRDHELLMKIRLNKGEDKESIRQNFTRMGVVVQEFKLETNKNTGFSTPIL